MALTIALADLQVAIADAWGNGIRNADTDVVAPAIIAQLDRQTATIGPLVTGTGRNAKQLVKTVFWQDVCPEDPGSCTTMCDPVAADNDDTSQDYEITTCKERSFALSMKQYRTSPLDYMDTVALRMAAAMKDLEEMLDKEFILFLEANKGTQEYLAFPFGADASGDWEIPANYWDIDLIPQLELATRFSRFNSSYILDGTNLWTAIYKAGYYAQNPEGRGENALFATFPYVFDPLNMAQVAANKTYLVNGSAVALATANWWGDVAVSYAPGIRTYRIPSQTIPGVYFDVIEHEACLGNDFVQSYKIQLYYDFFLNPVGCTPDRTGIIAFEKTAAI